MARFPFLTRSQTIENWREPQHSGSFLMWAGKLFPVKSWLGSASSSYSPTEYRPSDTDRTAASRESVIVYRCVTLIANTVNDVPYYVEVNGERVDSHPLLTAIEQNYRFNRAQLFGQWARSLQVYGECYIEKIPSFLSYGIGGLRRLNNNAIDPDITLGQITSYTYSTDSGITRFKTQEILFDKYENDGDDLRGLAPLDVALAAVNIDRDQQESIRSFLRNNATPAGILTPKPGVTVTPDQRKSLMEQWQERFKGARNRGRVGFLTNSVEYQQIGESITEPQLDLQDSTAKRICMAFGVPTALLGAWDTLDYQANPVMLAGFYHDTIQPVLKKIETALNFEVVPLLEQPGVAFKFDYDSIASKLEDKSAITAMYTEMYKSGGISLNEYRRRLGEEVNDADDFYYVDGVGAVPKAEIPNIWKYKLLVAPSVFNSELVTGEPLPQPVDPNQVVPTLTGGEPVADAQAQAQLGAVDPTKDADAPGLCVMLDLSNNADLIALQRNVKSFVGAIPVDWNDPATFHITLADAPVIDEATRAAVVDALQSLDFPELKLNVGSLKAFDAVGKYALHFRIRNNSDLLDFQETVYDLLTEHGVQLSSYSNPGLYIPHITMGYASQKPPTATFKTRLTVQPTGALIVDGDETFGRIGGDIIEGEATPVKRFEAALDELRAWEKFVRNGKAGKRPFIASAVKGIAAAYIELALEDGDDLRSVFDTARALVVYPAVKSFADTKRRFMDEIRSVFIAAQADETTRRNFAAKLRASLRKWGLVAFRDGMNEGGYDPESFSKDELATFRRWQEEQSTYVSNVGKEIFGQGITENEAVYRVQMWADVSLGKIFYDGLYTAGGELRLKWSMGDAEHCGDCPQLHGVVMTASDWKRSGYQPRNGKTECSLGCKCSLTVTNAPLTKRLPYILRQALGKAIDPDELEHVHTDAE